MIKLDCLLIAAYAGNSADGRLTIAGTFDSIEVRRADGAAVDANQRISFPAAYLAIVTHASLSDGLRHRVRLRVLDGDGNSVADEPVLDINYRLNRFGQPMRNSFVVNLSGLSLPGPDDYVFELRVEGAPSVLGELTLPVMLSTPTDG